MAVIYGETMPAFADVTPADGLRELMVRTQYRPPENPQVRGPFEGLFVYPGQDARGTVPAVAASTQRGSTMTRTATRDAFGLVSTLSLFADTPPWTSTAYESDQQ